MFLHPQPPHTLTLPYIAHTFICSRWQRGWQVHNPARPRVHLSGRDRGLWDAEQLQPDCCCYWRGQIGSCYSKCLPVARRSPVRGGNRIAYCLPSAILHIYSADVLHVFWNFEFWNQKFYSHFLSAFVILKRQISVVFIAVNTRCNFTKDTSYFP